MNATDHEADLPEYRQGRRLAAAAYFFDGMASGARRALIFTLPLLIGLRGFGVLPEWVAWPLAVLHAVGPVVCLGLRDRLADKAEVVFQEEILRLDREIKRMREETE